MTITWHHKVAVMLENAGHRVVKFWFNSREKVVKFASAVSLKWHTYV